MTAKELVENTYDMVLSNRAPFHVQLTPLDTSGELSNLKKTHAVLFGLAEMVDELRREIDTMKQNASNQAPVAPNTHPVPTQQTQEVQHEPITPGSGSDANTTI